MAARDLPSPITETLAPLQRLIAVLNEELRSPRRGRTGVRASRPRTPELEQELAVVRELEYLLQAHIGEPHVVAGSMVMPCGTRKTLAPRRK